MFLLVKFAAWRRGGLLRVNDCGFESRQRSESLWAEMARPVERARSAGSRRRRFRGGAGARYLDTVDPKRMSGVTRAPNVPTGRCSGMVVGGDTSIVYRLAGLVVPHSAEDSSRIDLYGGGAEKPQGLAR